MTDADYATNRSSNSTRMNNVDPVQTQLSTQDEEVTDSRRGFVPEVIPLRHLLLVLQFVLQSSCITPIRQGSLDPRTIKRRLSSRERKRKNSFTNPEFTVRLGCTYPIFLQFEFVRPGLQMRTSEARPHSLLAGDAAGEPNSDLDHGFFDDVVEENWRRDQHSDEQADS